MPWDVKGKVERRAEFVMRAEIGEESLSKLCREFKISRPTGYLWIKRYETEHTVRALQDKSRRPKTTPTKISPKLESQICALRKRYGWAGKKLSRLLEAKGISVSVPTIDRVIKRNDLTLEALSNTNAIKRFQREFSNELWQVDFKGPMYKQKWEPLSILDDHSRFALALDPVSTKQIPDVQRAFERVFRKYGIPQAILLDHGVPWWNNAQVRGLTRFSVWIMNQDIQLCFSGIRHPQTQGKIERFHRTLKQSAKHQGRISNWKHFFNSFVHEYNYIRPHEALSLKTPSQVYTKSSIAYNPNPKPFEYPNTSQVYKVDYQGRIKYQRKRIFISKALDGQSVWVQELSHSLIATYRNSIVREINLDSHLSTAF